MAETTTAAQAPATPTGAPDTGGSEQADIDAQLASFITPESAEEQETEFTPGEDPEPLEAQGEEEPKEEVKAEGEEKKEEPPKEEKPMWTVKVNGQEYDVDEQELVRGYQLGMAATQKFQEAAKQRADVEKVLLTLKNEPLKILLNPALGLDFRKIAEEYLIEQLRLEQADPATKAQLMAEQKLRQLEAERDALRRQQEEAEVKRQSQVLAQQIDQEFTRALAAGKVPKTPTVVKRMADLASQLLDQGYEPTAEQLVDMVRQEIIQAQSEILGKATPEETEALLGKEKMKQVRQADLAKAKKPTVAQQVKKFAPQPSVAKKGYVSEKDLREHVKKTLGGR